ncbi:MAG: DEAD/DEAH box helicase [Planctomycetes bacterium]|nr:DEAD/DEAH box helicase [Planctomycetota bacterium]
MAQAVEAALADGRHLIVEAGTGVGKSFGYLVPAILHVLGKLAQRQESEKVPKIIISTHTINLQEQLIGNDLPFLRSVMPDEFTAVLVKGRRNYLSRRRLGLAVNRSGQLFGYDNELLELQQIDHWAARTTDGTTADLSFRPQAAVWEEVASDSANCLGRKCAFYDRCFYFQDRRRMQNAQLLIVNHALFFSDLALRRQKSGLFPNYDAVIFDEAHSLESVAAEHLGLSITSGQVHFALTRLFNPRTGRGLLATHDLRQLRQATTDCLTAADRFFAELIDCAAPAANRPRRTRDVLPLRNRLSPALGAIADTLGDYAERLTGADDEHDFTAAHQRIGQLGLAVESWHSQAIPDSVYWLEANRTKSDQTRTSLFAAPIDVGPILASSLFAATRSVILTSATLSTGRPPSFDFFQKRIGLESATAIQLGSPFDYRRQAKLILLDGMPDPGNERDEFERQVIGILPRFLARSDGHAFVLFTSFDLLRRAVDSLSPWLSERRMTCFSQASGQSRKQLLDQFRATPRAVLFGTDSFWQGVDVPGDALRNVIITKLPFSVPDHPLLEARLESIRDRGGSPFFEYQLPEAIIKLRQGFGRLIRSTTDTGIVVILDPRIRTKAYGRTCLDSLPNCEIEVEPAQGEIFDGTGR